jgi:hypothetical protein
MSTERSPDFRFIYANRFGLKLSDNDIGLLLTNEQVISHEAYVVMTPRALKILSAVLADAVHNLERQIGEIKLPEQAISAIDLAKSKGAAIKT